MSVYAPPKPESKTCRGKSGKSKPHPHYGGQAQFYVSGTGYVSRCTSCEEVVAIRKGDTKGYQPVEVTPEFLAAFLRAAI